MIFLLTIHDKMLYGEPDIALGVVDAEDEESALRAARPTIEALADRGRGRCVVSARALELGKFYRLGAVVRLSRFPDAVEQDAQKQTCTHGKHLGPTRLRHDRLHGVAFEAWICERCGKDFTDE